MDKPCLDHGRGQPRYATTKVRGVTVGLHVKAYCEHNGLDPLAFRGSGNVVRHTCDNWRCIEPTHLEVGTQADNIADRDARGRTRRGEQHYAAKLSDEIVCRIRGEYQRGSKAHGSVALGKKYGVSYRTILYVTNGARRIV